MMGQSSRVSTKLGSLGNVYVECEKCKLYRVGGVRYSGVSNELKSMEKQSGLSDLSVLYCGYPLLRGVC